MSEQATRSIRSSTDRSPVAPGNRRTMVRMATAGLVANVVIVLTGALVRLTGSGLGCPTWPRCTDDSFVTTPEMGLHGVVEFANRVVGIAVGLITLVLVIVVLRHRPRPRPAAALAIGTLALVVAQGFIGGLSVRQELAPEIVAVHFLVSMVIVAGVTVLVDILRRPRGAPRRARASEDRLGRRSPAGRTGRGPRPRHARHRQWAARR